MATIIPTERPTDLATFTIKADGKIVPKNVQIISINVSNEINRIPTLKLVVSDGDPASAKFEHSEGEFFRPGVKIEITAGYHSKEELIFKGMIISQKVKIRKTGSAFLVVKAKNAAFKMVSVPKYRLFKDMTDSDIVEEILSEYGIKNDLGTSATTHEQMVQNNINDWDFIYSRLEYNGFLIAFDEDTLKTFKPSPSDKAVLTVAYGSTILEADLELDSRVHTQNIIGRTWESTKQNILESEKNYSDEPACSDITIDHLNSLNDTTNFYLNSSGQTIDSEILAWADALKMKQNFSKIRGSITFQGFPIIKPGDLVHLQGFGSVFNGKAFISGVHHEILEGNFVSTCQIGIDPDFFLDKPMTKHNNRIVPEINGLHCAKVLQLEQDPNGENRMLVNIPMINPDGEGIWGRVCTLDAGKNRGSFFLPEINDEVIVGFLANDPRYPVVLGMVNSSSKPAPITASDDNHEKGFVTRSKLKVLFNDDTNTIEISTPKGNLFKLDENKGTVIIEDENSNVIKLDSKGITINSCKDINIKAKGNIKVKGINVKTAASAEFKAEGNAGATLSTGTVCTLKGSIVKIN